MTVVAASRGSWIVALVYVAMGALACQPSSEQKTTRPNRVLSPPNVNEEVPAAYRASTQCAAGGPVSGSNAHGVTCFAPRSLSATAAQSSSGQWQPGPIYLLVR